MKRGCTEKQLELLKEINKRGNWYYADNCYKHLTWIIDGWSYRDMINRSFSLCNKGYLKFDHYGKRDFTLTDKGKIYLQVKGL
jgi:hypothetical protein